MILCFQEIMNKKILITLGIIVWALYAIGNANIVLKFPDLNIQSFENKFSLVHFTAPGNNFLWSIFRLASKSTTGMTIGLNGQTQTCSKLIRGLYFNSQRGKRIRPLDSYTLTLLQQQNDSYDSLQISWWLYTTCDENPYSVFWSIKYTRWGRDSYIVAWTKLEYRNNKIVPGFAKSLQYFDNKVLIGYIYDSNGGIGYIGGKLVGHEELITFLNDWGSINSGFIYSWDKIVSRNWDRATSIQSWNNEMEMMRNLIIQWSVGLSKSIDADERLSLLGNLQNKTVIYNGSNINSSTLINFAKQKAQELCQGKKKNLDISTDEKILCYENRSITIDLDQTTDYENKTIIVKSGNVTLQGGMQESSPSIDLFVDKWLLYLPETFTWQTFDDQGYPSNTNIISSWLYLRGNFIINGLIIWGTSGFNHKLHLQGKVTTLNTPLEATTERINQIESMFGNTYNNFINLQNVFTRQCWLNGMSADGVRCDTGSIVSTIPLVILNGSFASEILQ